VLLSGMSSAADADEAAYDVTHSDRYNEATDTPSSPPPPPHAEDDEASRTPVSPRSAQPPPPATSATDSPAPPPPSDDVDSETPPAPVEARAPAGRLQPNAVRECAGDARDAITCSGKSHWLASLLSASRRAAAVA
jgi:hypothetical protein